MKRADLLAELAATIADLEPLLAPAPWRDQLVAQCVTARVAFRAAAVSIAQLDGGVLRYVAASGAGADDIVGTELDVTKGLAGFVAVSGQVISVERPVEDPRFARDVAEQTGFIPSSIVVSPVVAPAGGVVGVLSVLDRGIPSADALELSAAFAAQAAGLLPAVGAFASTVSALLDAIADAIAKEEPHLGAALRREFARRGEGDAALVPVAAVLADLRQLDPDARDRISRIITDIAALAARGRR